LIADINKARLESRLHPLWEADGPGIMLRCDNEAGKPNNSFNLTALLSWFLLLALLTYAKTTPVSRAAG
jgi:hypothetical protein